MSNVELDRKTAAAWESAGPLAAVHDDTGRLIGYFAPLSTDRAASYAAAAAAARLYRNGSGKPGERTYTTAEVLEHLKSLEAQALRFTVVWTADALNELTDAWNQSAFRNDLTRATQLVDQLLAMDPQQKGFDFYGDRLLVVSPLHVVFTVNEEDRLATVISAW